MKLTFDTSTNDKITLLISGHIELQTTELQSLITRLLPLSTTFERSTPHAQEKQKPNRLAYTVQETAELIGVSPITVYRLICRGLLRANKSLRCKIISAKEIERFLTVNT